MIIDIIKNGKLHHFKNKYKALFWLICFDSIDNIMWLMENWDANEVKIGCNKKESIREGKLKIKK
jgi:hypothetical protein